MINIFTSILAIIGMLGGCLGCYASLTGDATGVSLIANGAYMVAIASWFRGMQ